MTFIVPSLPRVYISSSFFVEVELIYNVVFISAVKQSVSVVYIYKYTYIYSFFRFFSIIGYYKILNIVPWLYSRSLLFIYFIFSSVYLLIPNS